MAILKQLVKKLVNQALRPFNICTMNIPYLQQLNERNQIGSRAVDDLELLCELPERHAAQLLKTLRVSRSQLRQDLFVLSELDFKRNGFFVEFGATNGISLSNTYLLEKEFGWTGILAEPAKRWHNDLKNNRTARIETDCVWRDSNSVLAFNEVEEGELSTIDSFSSLDHHREARKHGKSYEVRTISFVDLLEKYNAPRHIDYLSIDTEGSEYEILSNCDFDKYEFKVITCEHNYQPAAREKIYSLLTGKVYVRKFDKLSQFDDWFVRAE
jgi:FkbM family methyltransferase